MVTLEPLTSFVLYVSWAEVVQIGWVLKRVFGGFLSGFWVPLGWVFGVFWGGFWVDFEESFGWVLDPL